MKITPPLDPQGEFQVFMQMDACGSIELLRNEGHVFQRGLFFDNYRFGPFWGETVKEEFPDPHLLSIPEGALKIMLVIDLEHMFKVLPPPTAMVLSG